jgi:tRNA dimethylallyltransferase
MRAVIAGRAEGSKVGMEKAETQGGRPLVVVVAGPTASGKSALALDIAEAFGGEVINADALQLYGDLQVLSARPSAAEEARAPHRLYGVLDGEESASAGRWRNLALGAIEACLAEGRLPVLCGGTGLYIKALKEGIAPTPAVPGEFRQAAEALFEEIGGEALLDRLRERDPATASGLRASDRQRLVRAWSLLASSGKGLAAWREEGGEGAAPYRFFDVILTPPRDWLVARCDARFDRMLDEGALEEVKALLAKRLPADRPVMKAIGVPELSAYLSGEISKEEARARAQAATRRYAKRQMTWLRTQVGLQGRNRCVIETQYSESHRQKIFAKIRESLLTPDSSPD